MDDRGRYAAELVEWVKFAAVLLLIITIKYTFCASWLAIAGLYEQVTQGYVTDVWALWLTASIKQWVLLVIEVLFYTATLITVVKFILRLTLKPPRRGPWWV